MMPQDFYLPVAGIHSTQLVDTFGADRTGNRSHQGIDIFADTGTPVVAVRSGTVVRAGDSGGLGGLRVWIRDDEGLFHYYAHMNSVDVQEGQRVEAGATLGGVGQTGNARSTPPHLHYSVNPGQSTSEAGSLNPYEFLTGASTVSNREPGAQDRRARPTESVDVPTAADPATQRSESERLAASRVRSRDVMTDIMSTISAAASRSGGKVLDTRALFGDIFGRDDDEQVDATVETEPEAV